jgi:pterin-4a-carbinolamine dehydratase
MSKNSGALPGPGAQTGSIEFSLTLPAKGITDKDFELARKIED